MRDYIILNGQKSTEITGLLIQSLPPITKPLLRTQTEQIDGRDGDVITPLGYSAYPKDITIGLYGEYDIDQVIAYFSGSGTVTFSNEPDKYYYYTIYNQIDYTKLIRFKTAKITMHVQPFKYSLAETARTVEFNSVSGKGTSVTLATTGNQLTDFEIYGNSSQIDTPTTASPIPVKVVTGLNNAVFSSGSNSNVYSYNLGSLELAYLSYGADTFQDRLYKANGNWYIYKELGKYSVNTNNISAITSYSNVAYASIPRPTDSKNYNTYQSVPLLCTHGLYSFGLPSGWNTAEAVNKIFTQADSVTYWLGFAKGTTLAQMQSALSGAIIYYPLATPTTTQITDANLIAQLNAILGAETFNGSTTIKATQYTRAQPIYYVSVINESVTIQNIGNYIAKPTITIYGSGDIAVNLNGNQIFNIALGSEEYITIDTDQMEAYKDGILKNRLVTGNYDNLIFNVGSNTLSFTGDVEQVVIENYARWL